MTDGRFTLELGHWYGLTIFPGYGNAPYHSPIRVDGIEPLGGRCFALSFLNLGYAAGVQGFKKVLHTLRRGESHVVAEETEVDDRTYVICHFNPAWLRTNFPNLRQELYFTSRGAPIEDALLRLAASAY